MKYLSHFTPRLETLLSIIKIGFVFFPNERGVFRNLTASGGRSPIDEPQCNGMVSFTDTPYETSAFHRKLYGQYGIAVEKGWAIQSGACKAIYVGTGGPVFHAFAALFESLAPRPGATGDVALDTWIDGLSRTRPEFAKSLGAAPYSALLKLHEYMQTDECAAESEWRIIRPQRFHWSEGMLSSDVKRNCLLAAMSGIIPTFPVTPANTVFLACPPREVETLRRNLPLSWSSISVREHND